MHSKIHIIVSGTVQGVFFRANTKEQADKLGLSGFVRNLCDGTLEVIAEGDREKLEELLDWCYHGPEKARVTDIEFGWLEPTDEFKSFEIIR